jgi:hypothetical protein
MVRLAVDLFGSLSVKLPIITKTPWRSLLSFLRLKLPGGGGTVECVVLNACESEEMAKRLRKYGVPHVVCWRSEVQDVTAMRFSETFYKALDCQGDSSRDYKRAFEQASQPARMRTSESPGEERKPAKYQVRGTVDFICLLSKDGDVFPEPPRPRGSGM